MSLLRIGDFSQLAQVSTRTLRLYDELNLIKPARVDAFTGYRYYALEQLPRLNRILTLKDLGFSLEQIAEMLANDLTASQLRELLTKKQAELQEQLEEGQRQIARVAARLRQIEAEDEVSPYEVIVKEVAALPVASIRRTLPSLDESPKARLDMSRELYGWMAEQKLKPRLPEIVVYHNGEYVEEELDVEIAVAFENQPSRRLKQGASSSLAVKDGLGLGELSSAPLMASTVHHGSFADVRQAITALCVWAAQNDYALAGNFREIHLFGRELDLASYDNVIVEIQIPIKKKRQPVTIAAFFAKDLEQIISLAYLLIPFNGPECGAKLGTVVGYFFGSVLMPSYTYPVVVLSSKSTQPFISPKPWKYGRIFLVTPLFQSLCPANLT